MYSKKELDLVTKPVESESKVVRIANELIFSQFDLELAEQKLLYYAMSVFDLDPFLSDSAVFSGLTKGGKEPLNLSLITTQMINKFFWSPEFRAIRIPLANLIKDATVGGQAGGGAGYWKAFDSVLESLGSKQIYIKERIVDNKKTSHHRIPILGETYYINEGKREVVITFAQEFMPYVIALSGYKKIDTKWISKLEHKYSPRFLQFFIFALNDKKSGEFYISVDRLRDRLSIKPEQYKRGLYDKVIKKSLDDIIEKIPNINADVEVIRDEKRRGRPTKGYIFNIKMLDLKIKESKAAPALHDDIFNDDIFNDDISSIAEPKPSLPKTYDFDDDFSDMPF